MNSQALGRFIPATACSVLARIDMHSQGAAVRTQAAVVRSLVDEFDRHLGVESCAEFLGEQVKAELLRLMVLVSDATRERLRG